MPTWSETRARSRTLEARRFFESLDVPFVKGFPPLGKDELCTTRTEHNERTDSDWIVDVLNFDHVAEQYAPLLTLTDRAIVFVFIENDAGRVNDLEAALELDRL